MPSAEILRQFLASLFLLFQGVIFRFHVSFLGVPYLNNQGVGHQKPCAMRKVPTFQHQLHPKSGFDSESAKGYYEVVATQIFVYFHPYLGKISNLTSIFFRWVENTN